MKVFLCLFLAVAGMHHFLKVDDRGSGATAKVELPAWFTPEEWSPQERQANLQQCRKVVADLDDFIEDPPTYL